MLRYMRRADPILAARLPLPKECQSAIDTAKISDSSITVGNRPLQNFDAEKHTHRDLLKGHPFAQIQPSCVKQEVTRYLQRRYATEMLLFDIRGTPPHTIDLACGGDHGQGAFTYTVATANTTQCQSRHNHLILAKADQKGNYDDLKEVIGHLDPVFQNLETEGLAQT